MRWLNIVLFAYATLILVGGIFGYVKADSTVSLIMSAAAAALILIGVAVAGANRSLGYGICLIVALALAGFFGYRLTGGSLMPGLPALLMSVCVLGALAYGHFKGK